tara:strand:- start:1285 stop:1821 length:537 start_codon:yes stop_codon:yes gene_type:complete
MAANQFDTLTDTRTMADLTIGGQITPSALVANTNDYDPPHAPVAGVICISSTSAVDLTGLAAPDYPLVRHLINTGSFTVSIVRESLASSAANRFQMGGASHDLLPGQGAALYYHLGISRWILMHESVTSSASSSEVCITRAITSNLTIASGTTCIQRDTSIDAGVEVFIDSTGEMFLL